MIDLHTIDGKSLRVKQFREVPTPAQGFCTIAWHSDPYWIPGMEWIEAELDNDRRVVLKVEHIVSVSTPYIDFAQQEVGQ